MTHSGEFIATTRPGNTFSGLPRPIVLRIALYVPTVFKTFY